MLRLRSYTLAAHTPRIPALQPCPCGCRVSRASCLSEGSGQGCALGDSCGLRKLQVSSDYEKGRHAESSVMLSPVSTEKCSLGCRILYMNNGGGINT